MNRVTTSLWKQLKASAYHKAMLYEITQDKDPETALRGYLIDVFKTGDMPQNKIDDLIKRVQLDEIIKKFLAHNEDE